MLTIGSHANEQREPGQAGNGAAISVSSLCRGLTRFELAVAANSAGQFEEKCTAFFQGELSWNIIKITIRQIRDHLNL